jgi:hypothetical protein
MQTSAPFTTDKFYAAESIITLFSQLNTSAFPWEERIAVGSCQAKAANELINLYRSERNARLLNRLRVRPSLARPAHHPSAIATPLSTYLVDRGHPARQ